MKTINGISTGEIFEVPFEVTALTFEAFFQEKFPVGSIIRFKSGKTLTFVRFGGRDRGLFFQSDDGREFELDLWGIYHLLIGQEMDISRSLHGERSFMEEHMARIRAELNEHTQRIATPVSPEEVESVISSLRGNGVVDEFIYIGDWKLAFSYKASPDQYSGFPTTVAKYVIYTGKKTRIEITHAQFVELLTHPDSESSKQILGPRPDEGVSDEYRIPMPQGLAPAHTGGSGDEMTTTLEVVAKNTAGATVQVLHGQPAGPLSPPTPDNPTPFASYLLSQAEVGQVH